MDINTVADLCLETEAQQTAAGNVSPANSLKVKRSFEEQFVQTRNQLEQLDQILNDQDRPAGGKVYAAAKELVEDVDVVEGDEVEKARDARLICAAQMIEQCEIALRKSLSTNTGDAKGARS